MSSCYSKRGLRASIAVTWSLLEIQRLGSLSDVLPQDPRFNEVAGIRTGIRVQRLAVRKTWEPNDQGWKPGPATHQSDDSSQVTSYFLCSGEFTVSEERSGPCPRLLGRDLRGSRNILQMSVCLRALATGQRDFW